MVSKLQYVLLAIFVLAAVVGSGLAVYGSYHAQFAYLMDVGLAVAFLTLPSLAGYLWLGR